MMNSQRWFGARASPALAFRRGWARPDFIGCGYLCLAFEAPSVKHSKRGGAYERHG
jgi:hypothetical protein